MERAQDLEPYFDESLKDNFETLNDFDNFNNEDPADNDFAPVVAGAIAAAPAIGKGAKALVGVFKKDKPDASTTGYDVFMSSNPPLSFYPTKDEMIAAATSGKWDKAEPAAISASYNPQTGTWQRGDWKFVVTGVNPISARMFKGAKETHSLTSTINAKAPGLFSSRPSNPNIPGISEEKPFYKNPWIIGGTIIVIAVILFFVFKK